MSETFLGVMDIERYTQNTSVDFEEYLRFHVVRDRGIETIPNVDITVTKLNRDNDNILYNHFFNAGNGGITFKIKCVIHEIFMDGEWVPETWNGENVIDVLNEWYENMTVLRVATDAMDVPNGEYIITKNPSRVQNFTHSTVWELELTTYVPLSVYRYKNDNTSVLAALNKIKQNNNSSKGKKKSTYRLQLQKCNRKVLVYSKKKKVVKCVKYLQYVLCEEKLLDKKQIDGWFGKTTLEALKQFQKKHKKEYKLKVTGKVDKSTFDALVLEDTVNAVVHTMKKTLKKGINKKKTKGASKNGNKKK